jgi:chromosome segregation ATPase
MTDDRVYDKTNGWTPKKSFNEENRIFSLGEIDKLMKYVSKSDETRTLKKELSSTKKERDGFRDKCQELRDNIQTANTRIESLTQDVENHSDAHASTKREFEEFKQLRERELYSFCNRKRVFEKEVKTLKEDLDKANRYVNIHQDEAKLHQDNAQDLAAQLDEINERIENQWSTKVSKLIRKVVA